MGRRFGLRKYLGLWILASALAFVDGTTTVYLQDLLGAGPDKPFSLRPYLAESAGWYISLEVYGKIAQLLIIFLSARQFTESAALRSLSTVILISVWILTRYAWLYIWLGWPPSLMSYDVIFFAPSYWVTPVLCPLLLACTGIVAASVLIYLAETRISSTPSLVHWLLVVAGLVTCLYALMGESDYYAAGGLPPRFPWEIFWAGYLAVAVPTLHFIYALSQKNRARFR